MFSRQGIPLLIYTEWRIDNILTDKEKKEYWKTSEKQLNNREWKEELIHCIRNEDILIDYDVTLILEELSVIRNGSRKNTKAMQNYYEGRTRI